MKKRILSLLLCVTMLLTFLPQTVLFASAATSGTCGDNLCWSYNISTYTLTITGSGEMTNWNIYSDVPWYSYCSSIKSVSLPDGLTSIGYYAFKDCTGLTAISIPDSVTSIGNYAFYKCTGLTSITIPSGVTSIGNYAFRDCTGLTAISIPDSVTSIGNVAFAGCTGLTAISIPSGVTAISDSAFMDCTGLTAISIPDSVTSIGKNTFWNCTGLTAIAIPDGVTYIGEHALVGCTGLTAISIPSGVTSIGNYAFRDCTGLTAISIPDSVTSIGDYAFYGCTGLTSITIGNSVTSIGYYAFKDCTGLTDVYYPGTEEEWNAIDIDDGNDLLANATIHFGQTETDPCEGYTDIDRSSWYHSAADFVITRGLMGSTKTDALTFEPDTTVSRAMVASILYRMAGSPAVEYKATFTDVPADKWFTNAIEWCAQNGLASGKGDGKFDPNGNVTRQELAVFMKKMAEYLGKDTSGRADLGSFADGTSVPSWAKEYVQWAVSAGLISGKASGSKTCLAPIDTATRAEFASIIMRFVQNISEAK